MQRPFIYPHFPLLQYSDLSPATKIFQIHIELNEFIQWLFGTKMLYKRCCVMTGTLNQRFGGKNRAFPGGSVVDNPPSSAGNVALILGPERSPGGGNGNPLQYPCQENSMGGGASWATVHGMTKSWTQLSPHAGKDNTRNRTLNRAVK